MTEANWISVGAAARAAMPDRARHGQIQAQLTEVAESVKMTRQTLRNLLAAYDFLTLVKKLDREGYEILRRLPYPSVGSIARWFARDERAALDFIREVERRQLSVREIDRAEKLARPDTTPTTIEQRVLLSLSDLSFPFSRHDLWQQWERGELSRLESPEMEFRAMDSQFFKALGLTHSVRVNASGRSYRLLGITELSVRRAPGSFAKDAKAVFRGLAAASAHFPVVAAIAPDFAALTELLTGMPKLTKTDLPDLLQHDMAGERPKHTHTTHYVRLARDLGWMIFTSAEQFPSS